MRDRSFLIKEVQIPYNGTAGEAIQNFIIELPPNCRVLGHSFMVDGAANPLTNLLEYINIVNVTGKNWGTVIINSIFNSATLAEGNGIVSLSATTHLRYRVQSAAATANQFFLFLRFWEQ